MDVPAVIDGQLVRTVEAIESVDPACPSRKVAVSAEQQRRIRRAIQHTFSVRNQRTVALNRWLDEPGALRRSSR